jgi:hypothetical protein
MTKKKFIIYGSASLLVSTLAGVACGLKIGDITGLLTIGGMFLMVFASQLEEENND